MAERLSDSDRLTAIETRLASIDEHLGQLSQTRDEFIALKAKWGMAAAFIGAVFGGLVGIIAKMFDGLSFGP